MFAEIVSGMTTGNNDKYLRVWYELKYPSIAFNKKNLKEIDLRETKWIPYNKGGEQRKWYGNNEYVVNWSESGKFNRAKTTMTHLYLKQCITWSDISGNKFAGRFCDYGFMFDVKGSCGFAELNKLYYLIAVFNTKITPVYIEALNPTTTTQVGDLKRIPLIIPDDGKKQQLIELVKNNIGMSQKDWDSFEISWDFERHPLIQTKIKISDCFVQWQKFSDTQAATLKANEEELNRVFIEIYGLQDELTPEVEDKDITIRKADLPRDVRSFISYAVGCMFGRYSLDMEGLAYAGGKWDDSKYSTFIPDKDNIIPITDEEYFEDDIVARFVNFVKVVYGEDTLEENLDFIANALGNRGNTSREVIRNYFLKDFYKDHLKTYQKRPIYWLFDSGKDNGFKALIYLHRYNEDTVGRVRADYLHKTQAAIENAIARCDVILESTAAASDKAKAVKQKEKLVKQLAETRIYDQAIAHIAHQRISLDLDDGVVVNYAKFQGVEVANQGKKSLVVDLLGRI